MPRSVLNRAFDIFARGLHGGQTGGFQPDTPQLQPDDGLYPIDPSRSSQTELAPRCPLVRVEPRNMEEATIVADEIKRQIPVILNLEGCNPEEARRIRDFLGGVTYGLDGYMKKIGTWVYACSPHDMPIERLVLDGANRDQPRYEREDEVSPE